jgi:hypothetical protein
MGTPLLFLRRSAARGPDSPGDGATLAPYVYCSF